MKQILLLLFFQFTLLGVAQERKRNFEILKVGNKYSEELIQKAFSTADLCGSYLITKNHDIVLDDGTVVRLYPKHILKSAKFNDECFVEDDTNFSHISWSISSSAIIVKGYEVRPNKAYTK
ncbi:hypothetical protein [Flavobacterium sp.]|uniref:hypothetical protein n=1 Tax=Flavobacterium sp. TaxID=239 RepID=UPI002FDC99FF